MPKFTVHIEVYEGEYIIAHDTYVAKTSEEAARLAAEDYPGATITPICLCQVPKRHPVKCVVCLDEGCEFCPKV